ncbi:MAG: hypothetical protein V4596_05220 [Bdellovibrionota bacterium]
MSTLTNLIQEENFKFVSLPGSDPDPKYLEYYNSAYECWYKVWSEAYKELDVNKRLHSDDFTRQTEINCVFYGSKCIALLFLKWADFKADATKNDSYFKLWTDNEFEQLTKYGPEVIIISNTTVAKEWRGTQSKLSIKDLVLYFTIRRFLTSSSPAMTAVTRNARGVDKLIERFGAVMFKENVPNFNDKDLVNLGAFYKKDMTDGTDPVVAEIGKRLWDKMIVVPRTKFVIPAEEETLQKIAV